jgi:DNA ligase-1
VKAFADLYAALDRAKGTSEKLEALMAYFRAAPAADAAWAVQLLSGNRIRQPVSSTQLGEIAAEHAGVPPWLLWESYDVVGDLGETIALLLPDHPAGPPISLAELIEQHTLPLWMMTAPQRAAAIKATWGMLDRRQSFVWHKAMLGAFRVGVARRSLVRALAQVAGIEPAEMAHRMSGTWQATAEHYAAVMQHDWAESGGPRPYPFFLAHQLDEGPAVLGPVEGWLMEWKYDGIRAQLIHRAGRVVLWSRGEELIGNTFPEVQAAGALLPEGSVLDGEILAYEKDRPLPFTALQRRLGRKRVDMAFWDEVPVVFMAFDLLEQERRDIRPLPARERRVRLEGLLAPLCGERHLRLSPLLVAGTWEELAALRARSREQGVEGIMLKRRDSAYGTGRTGNEWWKWKVDPFTVDAVLIAAQRGTGRRAGLFTDFTFGVWAEGRLVPVTRAYSGLTDEEFREVDRFVTQNTTARHGPVRSVKPELVFEIGFEAIQESARHRSGVALRFPRMLRWRRDKKPADADTLETLRKLL